VSWQLGALLLLTLSLAGGFTWYERHRPDARIVALVATLAAFAALGRIAFATIPNVKPTTDIVLIAGYALGPAPGFVVGALAGLVSNFFFGQGPWTPWQMAAWGATGLVGAGLAAVTRGRLGRWPLALACLIVGFAFTVVQDIGDWVNYSDHSLAQLGIYVGKGVGFDAIHAAGCLVFALAFGPALIRSLARFATRLEVTWRPSSSAAGPLVCIAALGVLVAVSERPDARAASSPATYLLAAQNRDGGFGPAPGQASSQLYSGWAALGLAAEGYNPDHVSRDGRSVIDYLRSGVRADTDPGSLERTILAVVAAGQDPEHFGGRDLIAGLRAAIDRNGSISDQTNLTAFGLLALRAAGVTESHRTLGWLMAQEDADGGFNYATAPGSSDVDDTAAVLEALAGNPSPEANRVRRRAVAFIERHQNSDGGFPASGGSGSNAQSTAWAIQGLISAARDPAGLHRRGASSPLDYLRSLLSADGHVRYSRPADQTPVWVTAEAAMALARRPLPLAPVRVASSPREHRVPKARPRPKTARPPRRARRALGLRTGPPPPAGAELRLATDAGILDALALAPIGIG
jgi:energy-coupling factor transport system substrate-specific component